MTKTGFTVLLALSTLLLATLACSEKDTPQVSENNQTTTPSDGSTYKAPSYPDDYRSYSSWAMRDSWGPYNVHDPSMAKDGDYYYIFGTDASFGNTVPLSAGNIPFRRSKDLVNWEFMGMAFPGIPAWVKDSLNIKRQRAGLPAIDNPSYGMWAPCVRQVGNKFRLYYSTVVLNTIDGPGTWSERAFIGLAESNSLNGPWEDKGMVVCSEPDGVESYKQRFDSNGNLIWSSYYKFNAIDPSFIAAPDGKQWLIYGSWHTGIAALELNPATGKAKNGLNTIDDYGVRIAGRGNVNTNRWQALEAPEIIYNEKTGYYYLFLAYDELECAYNTRVARSKSITGPFVGIDGNNVTDGAECFPMITHLYKFNNHQGWQGLSHCCVFNDQATSKWYFATQGRLSPPASNPNDNCKYLMDLHLRELIWTEDGWPIVAPERFAAVPDKEITEGMLVGEWEHIVLTYAYQKAQVSTTIKLTLDKKITNAAGTQQGTYSFDKTKNVLSLRWSNGFTDNVYVMNGLDWEASPRRVTILYTGLNNGGTAIWGKKVY
ncbi:MAG: arabinan endo-1,5-alpha-L-arabinosidase [Bacteroidota bacterium]|nr:arabinan endo-1,5-alpha-L-arabinosidase [Bacteroidota bacterium]